jgi:hypothetical protein
VHDRTVIISVVYVEGCAHVALVRSRITEALRYTGRAARVREQAVTLDEDWARARLFGSPTILVDRRDPFPGGIASYACRRYTTDDGPQGAPSVAQLVEAIRQQDDLHDVDMEGEKPCPCERLSHAPEP